MVLVRPGLNPLAQLKLEAPESSKVQVDKVPLGVSGLPSKALLQTTGAQGNGTLEKRSHAKLELPSGKTAPANLLNHRCLLLTEEPPKTLNLEKQGPIAKAQAERQRMEQEARDVYMWSLITTGAPPKWEAMLRADPKFAKAVASENNRIYNEAMTELAARRASELGLMEGIEAQAAKRQKRRNKAASTSRPDGLSELERASQREINTNTTYGISAELQQTKKAWAKATQNNDRLILIGKMKGSDLKEKVASINPKAPILSKLEDDKVYGGDLAMVELDLRSYENWSRHLTELWPGDQNSGRITKTVQMKWGETSSPERMLDEVRLAAVQLSGARSENPLPGGHRVIDLGVLNPDHPWSALTDRDAHTIAADLQKYLQTGSHPVERDGLAMQHGHHVDRIKIHTHGWTFRFTVDAEHRVKLASAKPKPHQMNALLSVERRAKRAQVEWTEGTLTALSNGMLLLNGPGAKNRKIDRSALKGLTVNTPAKGATVLKIRFKGTGSALEIKGRKD